MKRTILFAVILILLAGCVAQKQAYKQVTQDKFAISQALSAQGKKNLRSANMHLGGKRHEKALPLYEQVLEENPNHIDALNNVAAIYYDMKKDYFNAREYFIKLIDVIDAITAEYEQMKETDPKAAKKYYKTNIKKPKLEKKLEEVKKLYKSCWVKLFNDAKNTEDPNDALKKWEHVYEVAPDSIKTIKMLAYTYRNLEDKEKMLEYMIIAAEMDPKDLNNRIQIASNYYDQENYEEAAVWFLEAAKVDTTNNPDNYYNAGIAYKNAKNDSLAYGAFQKAYEYDPENLNVVVTLSNVALALKDGEASTMYLQKAVDLDAADGTIDNAMYVTTLCYKLYGLKKFEELIEYAKIWHELDLSSKEAVQMLYNAAKEINNKELMDKYNKLYQEMQ